MQLRNCRARRRNESPKESRGNSNHQQRRTACSKTTKVGKVIRTDHPVWPSQQESIHSHTTHTSCSRETRHVEKMKLHNTLDITYFYNPLTTTHTIDVCMDYGLWITYCIYLLCSYDGWCWTHVSYYSVACIARSPVTRSSDRHALPVVF